MYEAKPMNTVVPHNARGRLPWDHEAPQWGRFDYTSWRESRHVRLMHWTVRGLYWQLLCLQWQDGYIPANAIECELLLGINSDDEVRHYGVVDNGVGELLAVAMSHFDPHPDDPDRLINTRQAYERWRAIDAFEKKSRAGKMSGKARARNSMETRVDVNSVQTPLEHSPTDIELDKETPSVPNGTADGDETWNERLAPYARAVGGDAQVGNWLKFWKPLVVNGTDEAEEIMWGLRWLIDKGQLEYMGISKGGTCKPSILKSPRADILKTNALEAYNRHAPNPGQDVVRKLTAI